MITNYHRPKTIEEAIELLSRTNEKIEPLGGGTTLAQIKNRSFSVVDLQMLGLDKISAEGTVVKIGGTTTLNEITTSQELQPALKKATAIEANFNLRQKATIAGGVVSADGRSPLATALLALDARLIWLPGPIEQSLGDFLLTRSGSKPGKLIVSVSIPLITRLEFESVARTPFDRPILAMALARWPSGRTRISLGGFGDSPITALDAPDSGGAEFAVRDALTRSGDAWASAEYRQEAAVSLLKRLLEKA